MSERLKDADEGAHALAAELRVVLGKLIRKLRQEIHVGGLSTSQVTVMGRLDREGPATVSTLARADSMRPQSMGAIVADLEKAGLVQGAPDPRDGRQTLWSPTEAGQALILSSRAAREDWLYQTIISKLSAADQAQLAVSVDLLKRITDV